MSRAARKPRVRLSGPAQLVASIPYLVGFHPEESIVAIGMTGKRHQIGLTMRVDLPDAESVPALADLIATHLAHAGSDLVVLVVCTEEDSADLPRQDLVDATGAALADRGVEVQDALCVRGGRWWSYLCAEPRCCPPEGTPVDRDAASEIAAANAWTGEVVHDSRRDLEATLAPIGLFARAGLTQAFDRVGDRLAGEIADRGLAEVSTRTVRLLHEAVQARAEASPELTDDEVARLALGLLDVTVRDQSFGWAGTDLEHAAEALWVELIRKAEPPYDAPPATLLAAHAYLRGNGAYARVAVERALASDPGYSLALLLAEGLDRAVPPSLLRQAFALTVEAA